MYQHKYKNKVFIVSTLNANIMLTTHYKPTNLFSFGHFWTNTHEIILPFGTIIILFNDVVIT